MAKWIKTSSPGVRFREHPARKHGILPDRYYSIYYKIDSRQVEEALGWASEGWTQEKAAAIRHQMKNSAKSGGPRTLKEARAEASAALSVGEVISEFWEKELQHKKAGAEKLRLLKKDVLPLWSERKVADIKRRDIVLLLDRIENRAPVTRNRVQGALTRLFNFAAERGVIENSPCTRIRKVPEKGRSRVLNDEEIKLLWAALEIDNKAVDIYPITKLVLKMILLTGQRPGEVSGTPWAEIDEESGFWNIPAARMKNKEAHRVPLCKMALDVIEQARLIFGGDSTYVFRSSHFEDDPIKPLSLSRAVARHWKEIGFTEKFTPHDLRRTLRTRLAELGVSDVIGERVLGHKLQGVMAVYNRYSYDQEKRQALEQWERRLRRVVGLEPLAQPGKIITLRAAT
ncbi:MAG: site-specific integrase [Desulfobacteraceae bacterium]|nr:site-specific integrase [Desulfobacteraceae bacterium]